MIDNMIIRIGIQDVDVPEVASDFVIVQSEADDEVVRNLHGDIVQLDVLVIDGGLEQHGADPDLAGASFADDSAQVLDRIAGIHDVFHDDDAAVLEAAGHAHDLADLARRAGPDVGGKLHGDQFAIESEPFHEFGRKHDGAVQDAQEDRDVGAAFEIRVDAGGYLVDGFFNFFVGEERFECLVEEFDFLFHGCLANRIHKNKVFSLKNVKNTVRCGPAQQSVSAFRLSWLPMKRLLCLLCLLTGFFGTGRAQEENFGVLVGETEIEALAISQVERLEHLLAHPLRINELSRSRLLSSGLFSRYQVATLLDWRENEGDILSAGELALVDGFGLRQAELLAPFLSFVSDRLPGQSRRKPELQAEMILRGAWRGGEGSGGGRLTLSREDRWEAGAGAGSG